MDKETFSEKGALSLSLTRQPVFDGHRSLWGYEISTVHTTGKRQEADDAALTVASSAYMGLQQILDRDRKVIVSFSERTILEQLPYALPAGRAVVKITGQTPMDASLTTSLNQLKSDGYLLAVELHDISFDTTLIGVADIACVSVKQLAREAVIELNPLLKPYNCLLMATRVNNQKSFDVFRDAGVTLFQGSFFKEPEKITVRKLSSSAASRTVPHRRH